MMPKQLISSQLQGQADEALLAAAGHCHRRCGQPYLPAEPAHGQQHRQAPQRQRLGPVEPGGELRGEAGTQRPAPHHAGREDTHHQRYLLGKGLLDEAGQYPLHQGRTQPAEGGAGDEQGAAAASKRMALPMPSSSRAAPSS